MCIIIDPRIKEKYQGITKGYKIYKKEISNKELEGEFHKSIYKLGKTYNAKKLSKDDIIHMSSFGNNLYGFHILLEPIKYFSSTHVQIEIEFSNPVCYGQDELYRRPSVIARNIKLIREV